MCLTSLYISYLKSRRKEGGPPAQMKRRGKRCAIPKYGEEVIAYQRG